jgi:hypothetical protein
MNDTQRYQMFILRKAVSSATSDIIRPTQLRKCMTCMDEQWRLHKIITEKKGSLSISYMGTVNNAQNTLR